MNFLSIFLLIGSSLCMENDFKGFDDTILFGINWPGSEILGDENNILAESKEVVTVTTTNKEKYKCHLPEVHKKQASNIEEYDGPSPIILLQPLFSQKICSYRLETYWSYEMCHGRYIRQYHEEREGKQVKTQEYFLGHYNANKDKKETKDDQEKKAVIKTTQVEGMTLPCLEIDMDDGTVCDLNGKPRHTKVLYVCYAHGKHEVYSFKEISTCAYEAIILSPLLCEHPHFKPKDKNENIINCIPVDDAPKKPRSLLKHEVESLKFQQQSLKLVNEDGEAHLKLELHPLSEDVDVEEGHRSTSTTTSEKPPPITDDSPVRAFLNGENCLSGGTGWWKYEFCYGRHVEQYHVDRTGEKTTLLLGRFHEDAHIAWIKDNRGKAPQSKDKRTSISHFYSDGDFCDETEKPRQTEVKLKCVRNSSTPAQVSLYLLEPRTCHYILGVESPLICDILPHVDEYGLVRTTKTEETETKEVSADEETKAKDSNIGFDLN
ncbi:endoplasmic reticulum lectin 1 isoform X2 [Aricia agestis]|uniref:endoplasmic reticulum lectin 1 isoform X2 n=1 Tax=Aricia agestis TaxID=91739 RepID=UPI001C201B29|nr:endoplasmic reticulum lectin 1 isoform X2 [Aricia agestis]